ncbi:cryptochrome/photolyase family protein [Flammeovirga aprica]|uniref:Cryptochrome/photolyase family protein n=1 Tax=Flammeovirga aprica JL-4 TaxID=694437 RepID=A0A7X9P2G1_9BACT|nr:cryptochrome/photolyase family protein [Flammeovirga aprica]NME68185.1 cryptochrome/photolyase family protein [Flammeovirga aprica JL-4]
MIALVFPHQLFENSPLFNTDCNTYVLVEEYLFFYQYKFHKQKLLFHRTSMMQYASFLEEKGYEVVYRKAENAEVSDIHYVIKELGKKNPQEIVYIDPVDDWLSRRLIASSEKAKLKLRQLKTPMFLNDAEENSNYFKAKAKKFYHANFYKKQRIAHRILITEDKKPVGGKWSFDEENRKKYPAKKIPPFTAFCKKDGYATEAMEYVEENFSGNYGIMNSNFLYPTNFVSAKQWLESFLMERFLEFGTYEDAIVSHQSVLYHSLLSPLLNAGLLTPDYVIERIKEFTFANNIPLNSAEGLIRQIIGWREFIRGVYEAKGREERTSNYFRFDKEIPPSFYDGTTGIRPVDITIKKVLSTGYCHHIERLMVLGNFMLLCEFNPNSVYRWFMELFIDAYDWVMVTNVYGMSQFADRGLMSTKPYISSSNYLMKMSDYQKGDWQLVWDGLFWRFMDKQRDKIGNNPRINMLLRNFDNMNTEKKELLLEKAEDFLNKLNVVI